MPYKALRDYVCHELGRVPLAAPPVESQRERKRVGKVVRVGGREAVERLHLPFAILSDEGFALTNALRLPTFTVGPMRLLKRLTFVLRDGKIVKTFYPVFPPDRNAGDVLQWLRSGRA